MALDKIQLLKEATRWLNQEDQFPEEMVVRPDTLEEHEHCYTVSWCVKGKEHSNHLWDKYIGIGRLLISKDGKLKDFEGSAPGIDWVHQFELEVLDLEDYWLLEIPYRREDISKIKTAIQCSTIETLKMVNGDNNITFTELKEWHDDRPSFHEIVTDLNACGVEYTLKVKSRSKSSESLNQ